MISVVSSRAAIAIGSAIIFVIIIPLSVTVISFHQHHHHTRQGIIAAASSGIAWWWRTTRTKTRSVPRATFAFAWQQTTPRISLGRRNHNQRLSFGHSPDEASRSTIQDLFRFSSLTPIPKTTATTATTTTTTTHREMSKVTTTTTSTVTPHPKYKFVDIGANLLDERYTEGIYHGKQRHEPDLEHVLQRSVEAGVTHLILTAGTLDDSRQAVQMVRKWRTKIQEESSNSNNNNNNKSEEDSSSRSSSSSPSSSLSLSSLFLGCTVGVHPTRCQQEFIDNVIDNNNNTSNTTSSSSTAITTADDILNELRQIAIDGMPDGVVVAIGEIGLDYDRLQFSSQQVQMEFFKRQLHTFMGVMETDDEAVTAFNNINNPSQLPKQPNLLSHLSLFLHNRNVGRDLLEVLQEVSSSNSGTTTRLRGVVHSFDDSLDLATEFIDMGLYIGLNGCSLKTNDNLMVVKSLPLDSILLETDCPYCEIKATHAGHQYIQTSFQDRKKVEKKFEMGKMVKGRNEPCQIVQVAEVIAGVKGIPVETVIQQCYDNSLKLYGWEKE